MQIILIILTSILIGLFVVDIILGFINSVFECKRSAELDQRLDSIETLLSDGANSCFAIGFEVGGDSENVD